jgi:N-acetylneuraminate synthase
MQNKIFRRSLYFVKSLIAGEEIKSHHVRRIRPGFGIACKHYDEIIGRRVKHNVDFGDPVRWEDLS